MQIGRIVKSNSHVDFVCQAWAPSDVDDPPKRTDYSFGTFVSVELADAEASLIGVVYDTILHDPEFGSGGPRLLAPVDSEVLTPDRYSETATLVGILALGSLGPSGATHGVVGTTPAVGARVSVLGVEDLHRFHRPGGRFAIGYAPHILAHHHPLVGELLLRLASRLSEEFPEESAALAVVQSNLSWQLKVQQAQ